MCVSCVLEAISTLLTPGGNLNPYNADIFDVCIGGNLNPYNADIFDVCIGGNLNPYKADIFLCNPWRTNINYSICKSS